MALLQILIGLGLVAVAFRGHQLGELRAGSAGFDLLVWGVFALLGIAKPMPID